MKTSLQEAEPKRILIVEDDPVHRKLLRDELKGKYRLDFAPDSQSALSYLQTDDRTEYDAAIVDLRIPEHLGSLPIVEEGFKVLDHLQGHTTVVVVMSGNMIERIRKETKAYENVQQIFEKPFSLKTIHSYIDSIMQQE